MHEPHSLDSVPCALCAHIETRVVQRIASSRLAQAYRSELGLAVEFTDDELFYRECAECGLLFFSPAVTGDEHFYGNLQHISWYYSEGKQAFRIAAPHVEAAHHVLEIGAGRGLFAKEISPASYTGLEFSPAAIQLAAQSGIRLLSQTIEEHALERPNSYDVVCAFEVLEHVAAPRTFLDAAIRCLKPGGRLLISVPGQDSFQRFALWDVLNMPPHHITHWTDECLRAVGPICGVRVVSITPEPLGRNMRRLFARAAAERWLVKWFGFEPQLLDARLRSPLFRSLAAMVATIVRRYLAVSDNSGRRGQSVVGVFQKEPAT